MNEWCWVNTSNWWSCVEGRTSWLELVAAFVSVLVSVIIALKIQEKDFEKRTSEAMIAETSRRNAVRREWKLSMLEKSFDNIADAAVYANSPANRATQDQVLLRAQGIGALLGSSGGMGSLWLREWYVGEIRELIEHSQYRSVAWTRAHSERLANEMRDFLTQWLHDEEDFGKWSRFKDELLDDLTPL